MNDHTQTKLVKAVMQNYIDGTYEADVAKLKAVFHEIAVMNGYLGGDCILADPSLFINDMASAPSMKSQKDRYQAEIESIKIEGNIAAVVVSESGFRGNGCLVDCFHLIKTNGEWKIISKLFTTI